MKKFIVLLLTTFITNSFATNQPESSAYIDKTGTNMANMSMGKMMYMDIGAGLGTVSKWSKSALALDAMTMGFYMKKNLGVEIGMGLIAGGTYQDKPAMVNNFHLAAKGLLPFAEVFSLYGKLGVGASVGHGTIVTKDHMATMIIPNSVGPFYGAGIQFNFAKRFAIYIEDSGILVIPSGKFGNINQTTMGVEIRM